MSEYNGKKSNSRENTVSLDEKIQLFEDFCHTGEKIIGNTVYKGYPIGQWAIQIRKRVKKFYNGDTPRAHFSVEQLRKLSQLGILKKQIDSTIDEKIELLIQWKTIFPDVELTKVSPPEKILKKYATSKEVYERMVEEYKRMQRYYTYLSERKSRGKLTSVQISRCKEANLKPEVFGYPRSIEDFAQKYKISNKEASRIIEEYKEIDNFVRLYRNGKLKKEDISLAKSMIRSYVDIDQHIYSQNYEKLIEDLYGERSELELYSSKGMQEVIKLLTDKQRKALIKRYGLENGNHKIYSIIAEEEDATQKGISFLVTTALNRIRNNPENFEKIFVFSRIEQNSQVTNERIIIERFKEDLDKSNIILKSVSNSENDFSQTYYSKKLEYVRKILSIFDDEKLIEETNEDGINEIEEVSATEDMNIDELKLSLRTQNCLKRLGFFTVGELLEKMGEFIDDEEKVDKFLVDLRGCGKKSAIEIKNKLKSIGLKFGAESQGVDLNLVRRKRDELKEKLTKIKEREQQAQDLLEKYDELLGENKKEKKHN